MFWSRDWQLVDVILIVHAIRQVSVQLMTFSHASSNCGTVPREKESCGMTPSSKW
jgi:hypothetical protein